jgi:lipid II:glycine glycyltransferase (peptidoglycan interpeptide bridge formation enzyme)
MIIREVQQQEKAEFNRLVNHPLQSWEWGDFRQKTGLEVVRLGVFEGKKLIAAWQMTVHPLPKTDYTLIYFPKGPVPDKMMLEALRKLGQEKKAILAKLEPSIKFNPDVRDFLIKFGCQEGTPLFTRWTFQLDLSPSEEEILKRMKSKTRYNLKLAQRRGVKIFEDDSPKAFEIYLKLAQETNRRQGFYAHTPEYHRLLWETLAPTGMYHLFLAQFRQQILAAYIFFTFNQVLYYPYGGSTRTLKEVMPAYLLFWEAIKFGKQKGCQLFDMWGSLGPDPNPNDPWFGFHRFKQGFGAELVEFIGTYDLVINSQLYPIYNLLNQARWRLLRIKSRFFRK